MVVYLPVIVISCSVELSMKKVFISSRSSCNLSKPHSGFVNRLLKAAKSVTFDLLILELVFLFFKNTVKKLKFRYTFYQFRKS